MTDQNKKRVHEFAKELGVKSSQMTNAVQSITGAKGHASSIVTQIDQDKIKAHLESGKYKFPEKKNKGQVVIEYTPFKLNLIGRMVKMGMKQGEIAHAIGIAQETLSRHKGDGKHEDLKKLLDMAKGKGEYYMTKNAWRMAMNGNPIMTMFILKCKFGWSEKQKLILEGGDNPIKVKNENSVSIEDLQSIPLAIRKKMLKEMKDKDDE